MRSFLWPSEDGWPYPDDDGELVDPAAGIERSELLGRVRLGQGRISEAVQVLSTAVNRGIAPDTPLRPETKSTKEALMRCSVTIQSARSFHRIRNARLKSMMDSYTMRQRERILRLFRLSLSTRRESEV